TGLIVIVWIWKWTADDPKEQDPKEMFETYSQQENMQEPINIDEEKINDVLKDEGEYKKPDAADENKQSEQTESNKEEAELEKKRGGTGERSGRKSSCSLFAANNGLG